MKTLIIRSAPIEQFKRVFLTVQKEYPDSEISVLTHAASSSEILDFHSARLYTYTAKRISIFSIGWDYLRRLQDEKFDRVILIYTDILGQGYLQVQLFASVLKAKKVEVYNRNGQVITLEIGKALKALVWDYIMLGVYASIWIYLFAKKRIPHANRN